MKRVLLCASYSAIEPLSLHHLAGLARDELWDCKIHLVKDHFYGRLFKVIADYKPDLLGFNVYTGNHTLLFDALKVLKRHYPNMGIVLGGPHATYFPSECAKYADYVVMSEGFGAFRKILRGTERGIMPLVKTERFPHPERRTLYKDYPEFARSKIKSIIGMTGCPYRCTYCYNSSSLRDIRIDPETADKIGQGFGMSGRLFPYNVREVEDVVREGEELREWGADVVFFVDDVHGFDTKEWMPQFSTQWKERVGIDYHAQMRWEMLTGDSGKRRLDLVREAGGFGLTCAIEAADPHVRKEVLDRGTPQETMFEGMQNAVDRGFKIRTEQITGLPYGATTEKSLVNLEADLSLVQLNVELREQTGGPTMSWASTFAPYLGTKLGAYASRYGHYAGDNNDVPDTFFERSVLRFPKHWVGPSLSSRRDDESVWLDPAELDRYRDQNAALRKFFNVLCLAPKGHQLAKEFLKSEKLDADTFCRLAQEHMEGDQEWFDQTCVLSFEAMPYPEYFAFLPDPLLAAERFEEYRRSGKFPTEEHALSTATRHYLYDEVLYARS